MAESQATEIQRWMGRIWMSRQQRADDLKVREKFTRWYRLQFWPGGVAAMEEDDPTKRQISWVGMFARTMASNLYAQDPIVTCSSPWNEPASNEILGRVASNLPYHLGLEDVAQGCILDAILGRYAVSQVGYTAHMGWDAAGEDRERRKAQEENLRLMNGEEKKPREGEDHAVHLEEHRAQIRQLQQQAMQTQQPPPSDALAMLMGHIEETAKLQRVAPSVSPHEFIRDREVWCTRVLPVMDHETSFGWETDAPIHEARWFWRRWVRPLEDLKADPYLKNTSGLKATHLRGAKDHGEIEGLPKEYQNASEPDVEMVAGYELISRDTGKLMICVEGHDKWLKNDDYRLTDILKQTGYHILTLLRDSEIGPGKSPVEDAANEIIATNNYEAYLGKILQQSVPSKIADSKQIDEEEAAKWQSRDIGDLILLKFKQNPDDLRKVLADMPGARLPLENLAAITRPEGRIGAAFGTGDASLGGTETSKTATAAHVRDTASSGVIGFWGRQVERWIADNLSDATQIVKEFYEPDTMSRLLSKPYLPAWAMYLKQKSPWPEKLTVDVGSTMPGRTDKTRQEAMALFQAAVSTQGIFNVQKAAEDVVRAFGKDPQRYLITPDEVAQMAAQQPGPSQSVVGGPQMGGPEQARPTEAAPDDIGSQVRSNASARSAEVVRGQ